MLAALLIVFREVLEAALVISVVMTATRGLEGRNRWVFMGIGAGVAGAAIVAAFAHFIANAFQGAGQEIVNASILFIAVGLISWHVVWMNSHGRKMTHDLREAAKSVAAGRKHMSILAIVVGLAVMREGSEVVLMLQGLWTGSKSSASMVIGSVLGIAAGIAAGALLYFGLLALSVQRLFAFTNALLVLIAAGMAARGANFLVQADLLPSLGSRMWDTSFILSDDSVIGKILGALVGYIARPSGIEVLFYGLTLAVVSTLIRVTHRMHFGRKQLFPALVTLVATSAALIWPHLAHADQVFSPYIETHEWEFEHEGIATTNDKNPGNEGAQDFEFAIGYSPTSWYHTELESEFEHAASPDAENLHYQSFNWLNKIALAEPGQFWIDPAVFFEADFARDREPNNLIFGVIGAKQFGPVLTTLNLFGHKEYGHDAAPIAGFAYRDQTKYLWKQELQPGFEVYGDTAGATQFRQQELSAGPAIFGKFSDIFGRNLKYEIAYLFGVTPATPDGQLRWKLEYEWFF